MNSEFSDRLTLALKHAKLNQRGLSLKAGVSPSIIHRYVSGEAEPRAYNLRLIARTLNVSADYLLGLSDDPEI